MKKFPAKVKNLFSIIKVIAINVNSHTVYQNHFINDSFLKNRSLQQSNL